MIPGSRGRSARALRAAALAFVAGVCVALPAVSPAAAAAVAAPAGTGGQVWERAWSWDGSASSLPAGCTARAGGGLACTGRPLAYGRAVLRARLPRVPGAVTRIALGRAGITLPASAAGTHTYTLTWSPAAVTLAVDGHEVYRTVAYAGPRRLAVTVTSPRRVPPAAGLLVQNLRVDVPGRSASAAVGASVPGRAAPPPVVTTVAALPLPGQVGSALPGRLPDAVSALQTTTLGASWLLGGTCVAVGVLLGVLRAALTARRRPLAQP